MPTSGTAAFTLTRDNIIQYALRKTGVLALGTTPDATEVTNAATALDMLLKSLITKGIKLWTLEELTLPLVTDTPSYVIGPTATSPLIRVTITTGTVTESITPNGIAQAVTNHGTGGVDGTYSLTFTGATAGVAATGTYTIVGGVITSVTVNAGTGYSVAPTVTATLGSITGVTLTATISTLTAVKPMKLMQAWLRNTTVTPNNDIPLQIIAQEQYNKFGSKFSTGTSNAVYMQVGRDSSTLFTYLTPSTTAEATFQMHLLVQRPLQDAGTANQNLDFPTEWLYALGWNLAAELATDYGVESERLQYIEAKAAKFLQEVEDFDTEYNSVYFSPSANRPSV